MMATRDEATAALLGAVLLSETVLDTLLQERIRLAHFHRREERAVFEAMLALRDAEEPIDHLTLKARLEPTVGPGKVWPDASAMRATIDLAAGSIPSVGNVRGYCAIVRSEARFERAAAQLHRAGEALEARNWQALVAAVADVDSLDAPTVTSDPAGEFIAWYENERKGIPLPFAELTHATGGLQVGEVSMLAGWPGFGKTFLAKDMLLSATAAGARCHEYASETVGPRRTARLLSTLTGIAPRRIYERKLSTEEWRKVLAVLQRLPYETTPTYGWAVEDYCRDMRRQKWDLAVIDTVTRLPCQRVDEWDRASGMLADTAAQTGTHLVLICQLNLGRDTGARRPEPTGRDLRNTGAWYQDARVVMFVHRDQEVIEGTDIPRVLADGHVRIDKSTHGEPERGFVEVTFNPVWARFDRLDDYAARRAAA